MICSGPSTGPLQPTDRIPIAAIVSNELQGTLRLEAGEVEDCQSELEPSLLLPLCPSVHPWHDQGHGKRVAYNPFPTGPKKLGKIVVEVNVF